MVKLIKKISLITIKVTLNNSIQIIKKLNQYQYIKRLQNLQEHKTHRDKLNRIQQLKR
jgi:hypothetical protein